MADFILSQGYMVLAMPLAAFLLLGLGPFHRQPVLVTRIALIFSGLTLGCGLAIALAFYHKVLLAPAAFPTATHIPINLAWLQITDTLTANLGIYLDPISVMMVTVITVIGFLVQIYSVGYMRKDPGFCRFFALLALFIFAMLGLVLAGNLIQLFVFWELVGVSSYALIGFWHQKPSAVAAGKKAFIITRFADAFLLLGIIITSAYGGSFDFTVLNSPATAELLSKPVIIAGLSCNLLTVASLLIFTGGWGKSAMFPLHVWLPDAMEGPTPVSSIIHSATMVVAGVFLTARMLPLFAASDMTLQVVQSVGVFTALFAALIAIVQTDIKRILAYSTLSQLGYMMFALGVVQTVSPGGQDLNPLGYSASMFHIFTHAFFKCMLFLGAGSVIHAVHSNELAAMGGLGKSMPGTYWPLLAACLAIGGIPPLSGFWSKDAILLAAWQSGHHLTFTLGLLVGGLTALYMFRFFFLIFHGPAPADRAVVHENPWMTLPIVILTVPTVLAGWLANDFFARHFTIPMTLPPGHGSHPAWLPILAAATGLGGLFLAWLFYGRGQSRLAEELRILLPRTHRLLANKFYIDELYLFITHRIIFRLVAAPVKWFDRQVVDGMINSTGWLLQTFGAVVRWLQNGQLTFYMGGTLIGVIFLYLFSRLPL